MLIRTVDNPGLTPVDLVDRPRWRAWRDGLILALGSALVFQAVHAVEHAVQVIYWAAHPLNPPYMTPWAMAAHHWLAAITSSDALGMELLHLFGNLVFLGGLLGLRVLDTLDEGAQLRAIAIGRSRRTRRALRLQAVHVGEHVLLTASVLLIGRPWGVSTLFGALVPGQPSTVAVRVLLHFTLNAIPTALTVRALLSRSGDV